MTKRGSTESWAKSARSYREKTGIKTLPAVEPHYHEKLEAVAKAKGISKAAAAREAITVLAYKHFAETGIVKLPTIKKGKRISISVNASYAGQDEDWTERKSGDETLTAKITAYHFGDVKSFTPIITCFYREWPESKTQVPSDAYVVEIPAGAFVEYYDDDEVRVSLSHPGIKIWKIKKQP